MKFVTYGEYVEYEKHINKKSNNEKLENDDIECYNRTKIKEIDKKHDKMIRKVLSRKKEMVMFLNQFLNLEQELKKEQIEQCNSDSVTNQYKDRQADIIYKLKDENVVLPTIGIEKADEIIEKIYEKEEKI